MNVLIVGLGLIGGTYAKALKNNGYYVLGMDILKETLSYAKDNKIIDEIVYENELAMKMPKADIVVISLYPNQVNEFCERYKEHFKKNAVITDVSGIKQSLIGKVEPHLRTDVDFVFAHPMAGKETSGIYYSDPDIFQKANFIITPTDRNREKNIKCISKLAKDMGFKNVTLLSPENHDKVIAYTSQICHVIALALVNSDTKTFDTGKFTGGSYRDLTRISMMNDVLWSELFFGNKEVLIDTIDHFMAQMERVKNHLENEDQIGLTQFIKSATEHRKCIKK